VVLNLVTNARDSMPRGGRLSVQSDDVELTARDIREQHDLLPGPYVRITVEDTGSGIPAHALPHVFEPFFTTRQGGTGLGLATCYGIVKQSGGHIAVRSELERGTTFVVYLPRIHAREVEGAVQIGSGPPSVRGERVLVVEDEPAVRSVIERTLTLAGYRVAVASTGEGGLRLAAERGPFELLITDAVMPGLSGWEVGKQLGARWPDMAVLYISGYAEDAVMDGGVLEPGLQFLQKPFSPSELLSTLGRVLNPKSAP
jgi:CheY-like chemotaxis protein